MSWWPAPRSVRPASGVVEEARVDPRVPHDERVRSSRHSAGMPVHYSSAASAVEEVDPGLNADCRTPDQRLDRRVAGTGSEAAPRRRSAGAGPDGLHRVGHAQPEVLMAVESHLGILPRPATKAAPGGHPSSTRAPAESTTYTHCRPASAMIRAWTASFSGEWCAPSSRTRPFPGPLPCGGRSARSRHRPRCSGWRSGRSTPPCPGLL